MTWPSRLMCEKGELCIMLKWDVDKCVDKCVDKYLY